MMPTRNALATRFVIVAMASIATVDAACIDVVDVEAELPQNLVTSNNTGVSYSYNLEREQYHVSWGKEGNSGGPYGPFTLTRGCAPAKVKWESDAFLLLEAGCGTFCWYVLVFPLTESNVDHTRRGTKSTGVLPRQRHHSHREPDQWPTTGGSHRVHVRFCFRAVYRGSAFHRYES